MSYAQKATSGLMGLGAAMDDQDPVDVGSAAQANPILSAASLVASRIMLQMAAMPKGQRLAKMVSTLDRVQSGLGASARSDFLRRAAQMGPRKKDQAMFDAIRAALADVITERTLKSSILGIAHLSGLGQTIAEAQGRTSQGVNDANAIFCSYVGGTASIIGGVLDQTGTGTGTGMLTGSALKAGQMAGCNAGQLVIQGQNAQAQARLAQSATAQALAMQQESDARFMKFALAGAGLLAALGLTFVIVKKS